MHIVVSTQSDMSTLCLVKVQEQKTQHEFTEGILIAALEAMFFSVSRTGFYSHFVMHCLLLICTSLFSVFLCCLPTLGINKLLSYTLDPCSMLRLL